MSSLERTSQGDEGRLGPHSPMPVPHSLTPSLTPPIHSHSRSVALEIDDRAASRLYSQISLRAKYRDLRTLNEPSNPGAAAEDEGGQRRRNFQLLQPLTGAAAAELMDAPRSDRRKEGPAAAPAAAAASRPWAGIKERQQRRRHRSLVSWASSSHLNENRLSSKDSKSGIEYE